MWIVLVPTAAGVKLSISISYLISDCDDLVIMKWMHLTYGSVYQQRIRKRSSFISIIVRIIWYDFVFYSYPESTWVMWIGFFCLKCHIFQKSNN
jgi:hypothetical protein